MAMRQFNNNYDRKKVREYIVSINNLLFELKDELGLDIPEINKISDHTFDDKAKKEIIDFIKSEEEQEKRKDTIRRMALIASGVKDRFENPELSEESISYSQYVAEEVGRKINNGGLVPPKTDWERISVSKDEKDKIIQSIKANPNSNVFSKDFKWNPKDFLGAFTFLEEAKDYNGPLLVSLITDREQLESHLKKIKLSEKIEEIFAGKFVLLLSYDITASSSESKYIYLCLNYNSLNGSLEFETAVPADGIQIKKAQKTIIMEYMDSMGVSYSGVHKNFPQ
jgi:hypothetical protein